MCSRLWVRYCEQEWTGSVLCKLESVGRSLRQTSGSTGPNGNSYTQIDKVTEERNTVLWMWITKERSLEVKGISLRKWCWSEAFAVTPWSWEIWENIPCGTCSLVSTCLSLMNVETAETTQLSHKWQVDENVWAKFIQNGIQVIMWRDNMLIRLIGLIVWCAYKTILYTLNIQLYLKLKCKVLIKNISCPKKFWGLRTIYTIIFNFSFSFLFFL